MLLVKSVALIMRDSETLLKLKKKKLFSGLHLTVVYIITLRKDKKNCKSFLKLRIVQSVLIWISRKSPIKRLKYLGCLVVVLKQNWVQRWMYLLGLPLLLLCLRSSDVLNDAGKPKAYETWNGVAYCYLKKANIRTYIFGGTIIKFFLQKLFCFFVIIVVTISVIKLFILCIFLIDLPR